MSVLAVPGICGGSIPPIATKSTAMQEIIKSRTVSAGTRIYHVDRCVDKNGNDYMRISELSTSKENRVRHQLIIYPKDIPAFAEAVAEISKEF